MVETLSELLESAANVALPGGLFIYKETKPD